MEVRFVLSLFDGMSCGQIALNRCGIKYDKYYAAEIDKHAMKVTQANYPNTIQLGDVTKWKEWDIDWSKVDLLLAGSPCQGFSFAGKQLAFDDPRSALFFVFVDIWKHIQKHNSNAKYLLENVRMKKEHEDVITKHMGVNPITINSALLSAQSRIRLYWTNIGLETCKFFGVERSTIKQPDDKGILLRDILESDVQDKYYLSEKMLQYFSNRAANFNQGKVNVREEEGKASCLLTAGGNSGGLHSDMTLVGCIKFGRTDEAKAIRKESMSKGVDYTPHSKKEITGLDFDKMNTLTTASNKDNLLMHVFPADYRSDEGIRIRYNGKAPTLTSGGKKSGTQLNSLAVQLTLSTKSRESGLNTVQMLEPRYDGKTNCLKHAILEKSPCLHGFEHGTNGQFNKQLVAGGMIRRLTPTECERLQTVPDNYTNHVSDTQRYKMLGNGWTVDVICHIFNYLKK